MRQNWHWILAGLVFLLIGTLTYLKFGRDSPFELAAITYSREFRNFLDEAPKTVLNLDGVTIDTLHPQMVIGTVPDPRRDTVGALFLGLPTSCVLDRDSIYITDLRQHAILVANRQGKLIRKIGRKGKGPGDFDHPRLITKNSFSFFLFDRNNDRIQVFDKSFRYLSSVPLTSRDAVLAATDDRLYLKADYQSPNNLKVIEAKPPYRRVFELLPLPVSPLYPYIGLLSHSFVHSDAPNVVTGYMSLPYLFMYEKSGRHVSTLEFTGWNVKELGKIIKEKRSYGIRVLCTAVSVLGDDTVILFTIHRVLVLRKSGSGAYRIQKCFALHKPSQLIENMSEKHEQIYSIEWGGALDEHNIWLATNSQVIIYAI